MRDRDASLGGEASGHLIFHEHHTTGDGLISALQLLSAMCASGKPLSELARVMTFTPQKLINVDVGQKPPLEEQAAIQAAIRAAEGELADRGRVLVRYSGTQQMCRVMVEGPTEDLTNRLAADIAAVVQTALA